MSSNFAEVDKALAADPALYPRTHLLSISFDPTYDTPKVLRSYGQAYISHLRKDDFAHWDFAAPRENDLAAVTQFFNVGVTPGEGQSFNHSLSTVLVGKDGKIAAWYPTNDWKPSEMIGQIKLAAAV
jgi:protein SCO1/2